MPKLETQLRIDVNAVVAGTPGSAGASATGTVFATCDGNTTPDTILKTCADGELTVRYFGVGIPAIVNGPRITADGEIGFDALSTQSGQDVIYLLDDTGGAGSGNVGPSIGFGGPGIAGRRAAFGAIQTAADADQVGFVWYTHPSATGADNLVEGMRLDHDGDLIVVGDVTANGVSLGGTNAATFIVVSNDANLPNERALAVDPADLNLADGGAGNAISLTVNTTADGHNNPSTIIKADANGHIFLTRVGVFERLFHSGDTDTYLEFAAFGDQISLVAGNLSMLTLTESTQDLIALGPGSGDVDIDFNGDMFLLGSNGFFGIGNTSPVSPLQISNATPNIRLSDTDAVADTNVFSIIEFYRGNSTSQVGYISFSLGDLTLSNELAAGSILFRTGGLESESFIMDENGRFGVNTLTPGAPIDVQGTGATIRVSESATIYGQISHVAADNSLLIESTDGNIRFDVGGFEPLKIVNGTPYQVIVNDSQGSANFLVKGDGDESLFFVDAVNDRVGIGTGAPQRLLQVGTGTDAPFQPYEGIYVSIDGIAQVAVRNNTNNIDGGMFAHTSNFYAGTWTNHPLILRSNNADRAVFTTAGDIGFGTASPQGKMHGYDTISGFLHWEFDGLDGTSRVVIPGGTGDVLYIATYLFAFRDSSGSVVGGAGSTPNNGFTDFNTGSNTVRVSISAAGEMSVARVSGAGTIKVALWVTWL